VRSIQRTAARRVNVGSFDRGVICALSHGKRQWRAADDPPYSLRARGYFYVAANSGRWTDTPMWPIRCTSNSASRRSRNIPFRSSWSMAVPGPAPPYTGTPDGREGWAQYFVRQGYCRLCRRSAGRGRSGYMGREYGPSHVADMEGRSAALSRAGKVRSMAAGASAHAMAGTGAPEDPISIQMVSNYLPEIVEFHQAAIPQSRLAGRSVRQIGPAIPDGAFPGRRLCLAGADARRKLVKAIVGSSPTGPPFYEIQFHRTGRTTSSKASLRCLTASAPCRSPMLRR